MIQPNRREVVQPADQEREVYIIQVATDTRRGEAQLITFIPTSRTLSPPAGRASPEIYIIRNASGEVKTRVGHSGRTFNFKLISLQKRTHHIT